MCLTLNEEEYKALQQRIVNLHECSTSLFDDNEKTMISGISHRIRTDAAKPISQKYKNFISEVSQCS